MKLKLDADGRVVVQDGKPVYVHDDGKEIAFDAPGTLSTISRLNGEAKGHRERAEKAEGALKTFEGITDPTAALKALETVKNLDDKKLVDAGEVEKVKAAAIASVEEKYKPVIDERDKLKSDLYGEKIGGAFARSSLIVGDKAKLAIPADLALSHFGKHFSIDGGKIVAKGADGNQIYSRVKHGEPAEFDEALEILVDQYPHKESILRGTGGGTGARPGNGGGNGDKTISRKDFEALAPAAAQAKMKEGFKVVD
jgi:hypothetical protein